MDLAQYFERIGYSGPSEPTGAVLAALLHSHVCHVPFENLDVQLGQSLTIDPEDAYEKIVERGRGGWCYEQNGLFGWALSEIGFDVTRVAAAVRRAARGEISMANHLALLVRTEGADSTWLADVGFGGSMTAPIELKEGEYKQEPFRVGLRQLDDGYWQFWEDIGDGEFSYDFLAEPADETALADKCDYLQTSPDSGFVQSLVAQLREPEAHATLRGKLFSKAGANGVGSHLLESPEELVSVLRDIFALDLPEAADLWPRIERRHEELMREKALTDTYEVRTRSHNKPLS